MEAEDLSKWDKMYGDKQNEVQAHTQKNFLFPVTQYTTSREISSTYREIRCQLRLSIGCTIFARKYKCSQNAYTLHDSTKSNAF